MPKNDETVVVFLRGVSPQTRERLKRIAGASGAATMGIVVERLLALYDEAPGEAVERAGLVPLPATKA